jgi:agmatine deiminase
MDDATPAALGYRWPAEWELHAATWVSWPHNRDTWPGRFDTMLPEYVQFVRTLAQFEPVQVLAGGPAVWSQAETLVGGLPGITLHPIPTNDAWARDHQPTFLSAPPGSPPAVVDWGYNAWGGKYPPFDDDNRVGRRIAQALGCRRFEPGIVLEGGAVEGNGGGLVLTTESCLLNPNRNGQVDKPWIEPYLRGYLGVEKILWLRGGEAVGDDTDGHIDQLARFVGPTTIVAAVAEDASDANYGPLQQNWAELNSLTGVEGQALDIIALPMPRPIVVAGQRLPASYANFCFAEGAVLIPAFDDPADDQARGILAELFPEREVVSIPSRELVLGLGSLHCLSQQQPA